MFLLSLLKFRKWLRLAHRQAGLSPPVIYFYWPFQGGTSIVDHLCYLWFVFVMPSRLFIDALWSPEGKGLISWLLFVKNIMILLLSHLVSWDSYLIVSITDPCCLSYFMLCDSPVCVLC